MNELIKKKKKKKKNVRKKKLAFTQVISWKSANVNHALALIQQKLYYVHCS